MNPRSEKRNPSNAMKDRKTKVDFAASMDCKSMDWFLYEGNTGI